MEEWFDDSTRDGDVYRVILRSQDELEQSMLAISPLSDRTFRFTVTTGLGSGLGIESSSTNFSDDAVIDLYERLGRLIDHWTKHPNRESAPHLVPAANGTHFNFSY